MLPSMSRRAPCFARPALDKQDHQPQQDERGHNSIYDADSVEIHVHCLSPHGRKRAIRLDSGSRQTWPTPPSPRRGGHVVLAETGADGQGHLSLYWVPVILTCRARD